MNITDLFNRWLKMRGLSSNSQNDVKVEILSSPATEKVRSVLNKAVAAYTNRGLTGSLDEHFETKKLLKLWKAFYHLQNKESLEGAIAYRKLCTKIVKTELEIARLDRGVDTLLQERAETMKALLKDKIKEFPDTFDVLGLYQFIEKHWRTATTGMVKSKCSPPAFGAR